MKNEAGDILIHPKRGEKEKSLPEKAILVVNPAEATIAIREFRRYELEERFLYNSTLLVAQNQRLALAGPCLGAAAAGLTLEKLIALGVKKCCLLSCCGAIDRHFLIGDVVIAISGVVGEGVSQYYGGKRIVKPSGQGINDLRSFLTKHEFTWKEGGIWSTDAPYRESRSELKLLHESDGVSAVDMEFSALCSIAEYRGVDLSGLFVVSDELWGAAWNPGFGKEKFRKRCNELVTKLIFSELAKEWEDE